MEGVINIFGRQKSKRSEVKERKLRYLEFSLKHQSVKKIKQIFGSPNPHVRKQLYDIMKSRQDFKADLKKMKDIYKGLL